MKTKIYSLLLIVLMAFTNVSCLEDEYLVDWDKMGVVIELPYAKHYVQKTVNKGADATFDLMVNYTIADWRNQNETIQVGLAVDEAYLGSYEPLPASAYSLPASLTIEKQTQLTTVPLTVKTTDLEAGKTYGLPVVITSVPNGYTKSGNFNYVLFRVVVK